METKTVDLLELVSMECENFKCFRKSIRFDFTYRNKVRGKNRLGKTSLADLFNWVLFDKNAVGETNFPVRPYDKDQNPIRSLTVKGQVTLRLGEHRFVFRKEQHEVYRHEKYSYPNKYSVNGVDMKKEDYKKI